MSAISKLIAVVVAALAVTTACSEGDRIVISRG